MAPRMLARRSVASSRNPRDRTPWAPGDIDGVLEVVAALKA